MRYTVVRLQINMAFLPMVGHCTLVCIIKWVWVCRNKTTYLCNIPQIIVGPHLEEEEEEEEEEGGGEEEEEEVQA